MHSVCCRYSCAGFFFGMRLQAHLLQEHSALRHLLTAAHRFMRALLCGRFVCEHRSKGEALSLSTDALCSRS